MLKAFTAGQAAGHWPLASCLHPLPSCGQESCAEHQSWRSEAWSEQGAHGQPNRTPVASSLSLPFSAESDSVLWPSWFPVQDFNYSEAMCTGRCYRTWCCVRRVNEVLGRAGNRRLRVSWGRGSRMVALSDPEPLLVRRADCGAAGWGL